MSAAEHLDNARQHLAQARDSQARDLHGPAWDTTCRAIYDALSAAISHEREKGNTRIRDEAKPSNQLNVARSFNLISEEQYSRAQLILERTPEPYHHSMSVEDSEDAIVAAEDIIKTVEQRIEADPEN
jgi:hypothetical protein